MNKKLKYSELMRRAVEGTDLSYSIAQGAPKIEICGDREMMIEQHQGIIEYTTELLKIAIIGATLKIEGSDFELIAMSKDELRLRGSIYSVTFSR